MVRMHGHQEAVRLSPDLFRANTRAAVFCHIPHGTLMFGQSHYVPAEGSRLLPRHVTALMLVGLLALLGLPVVASMQSYHGLDSSATPPLAPNPIMVEPRQAPPLLREGLALGLGQSDEFDSAEAAGSSVLFDPGNYRMWYYGRSLAGGSIGLATSPDGRSWRKLGVVITPSLPAEAGGFIAYPEVIEVAAEYHMWYSGYDGFNFRILAAVSADGMSWQKLGVVVDLGVPGAPDDYYVFEPTVVFRDGTYYMWYTASSSANPSGRHIMFATSTDGISWAKRGVVLQAGPPGSMDDQRVLDPSVRWTGNRYVMIYAGQETTTGLQRLFWAESSDGMGWTRLGVALDVASPNETELSMPALLLGPGKTWSVYYSARSRPFQPSFQIFLAIGTVPPLGRCGPPWPWPPGPTSGLQCPVSRQDRPPGTSSHSPW